MVKCRICGAEYSGGVCPYCGSVQTLSKPQEKKEVPKQPVAAMKEPKKDDPSSILTAIDDAKTKLVERCRKSVVKVYCIMGDVMSTGTGFVIEGGYIITNAHVVEAVNERPCRIVVEYSDALKLVNENKAEVSVEYYSRVDDIAVLKQKTTMSKQVPQLKVSETKTKQGEAVFTIGNPLHYKFTYMEGAVANPEYEKPDTCSKYTYVQTTLLLNHGNSGGPVYDSSGEVIGMSTFGETIENQMTQEVTEVQGYGFCVSAKAISDAVKKISK